jgi:hypothetical protein
MQPMTAITLFWLRWQLRGNQDFAEGHQELLNKVWSDYSELFPSVDFERAGHVMLFRIGYADRIRYKTLRKDVEDFLL